MPEEVFWVTADGPARVAKITVASGTTVEVGDTLVELVNAELELASLDAERQAAAARAALASLEVRAGTELLANDSLLADLRAEREVLAARAAAADALMRDGLTPALDGSEARTRASTATAKLTIEERRRTMLDRGVARQIASQKNEAAKLEEVASFRRKQLAALQTKAPVAGVVQELPLEPGQWVTAGTVIAKIAKPGKLKAVLQVPEALVAEVAVGQRVRIEGPGGRGAGTVTRVDPLVQAGAVRVEVALGSNELDGARADLAVTAAIEVEHIADAIVMPRPPGLAAESATELYKLEPDGAGLVRMRVRLGRGSAREIEVKEGLAPGDTVAIGDTDKLGGAEAVTLAE